jgi:L-ascorbate metabolism protein UlaG (beta-lactamase superfamily)
LKLTKYGHCCFLVEQDGGRILTDPGTLSTGWDEVTGLTGVLVTHVHPDHLDVKRLPGLLAANPDAKVYADPGSISALEQAGVQATAVTAGDKLDLGVAVEVAGENHALIHADLPGLPNRGYLIAGRFYLPGDSLQVPGFPVEILGVPVGAPWMAVKESVEFLRAVKPRTAIPIHEKVLASPVMPYTVLEKLKPADCDWLNLDDGATVDR